VLSGEEQGGGGGGGGDLWIFIFPGPRHLRF
jgi:hypothetical protein